MSLFVSPLGGGAGKYTVIASGELSVDSTYTLIYTATEPGFITCGMHMGSYGKSLTVNSTTDGGVDSLNMARANTSSPYMLQDVGHNIGKKLIDVPCPICGVGGYILITFRIETGDIIRGKCNSNESDQYRWATYTAFKLE